MQMRLWKKYVSVLLAAFIIGAEVPSVIGGVPMAAVEAQAAEITEKIKSSLTMRRGDQKVIVLENIDASAVKWKSKKKSVATVTPNGRITALKEGKAKIVAIYGNTELVIKVTVKKSSTETSESKETPQAATASEREQIAKETVKKIIKAEKINKLDSDVAKVKAVHDYLVLNSKYDYNNYLNGTVPSVSYEAYGVLVLKTGVCDSYRKAFQLFMDALKIPCEGVSGTGNGGAHAWNIVTLDGERYHIDVTWDDPVPDKEGFVRYDYFLVDDATMKKDHAWDASVKACKGKKYRTYPYEAAGQKADTLEEAKAIIQKQCVSGGVYKVRLLVPKDMMTLDDIVSYVAKLNPNARGFRWSYYKPVAVGNYYFYEATIEIS